MQHWLDCIRSRKQPNANIRVAHAAARTSHIANQALRSGRAVKWNAATNEIDLIDPDYEYPQSLRGNIGYDRDLAGLVVGAEFLFNSVVNLCLLLMVNFVAKRITGNGLWR